MRDFHLGESLGEGQRVKPVEVIVNEELLQVVDVVDYQVFKSDLPLNLLGWPGSGDHSFFWVCDLPLVEVGVEEGALVGAVTLLLVAVFSFIV